MRPSLRPSPALAVGLLLLPALAAGCGGSGTAERDAPSADALPLRGVQPLAPLPKPPLVLPATDGSSYDFRARTRGRIALLFFGYTYCPDICPVTLATLASALEDLEPRVRSRVDVVFVTVDPERDTPERLRSWLSAFDSTFIGLRGSASDVEEALAFYRFPPPERSGDGPVYTVGHPAYVYLYTPDGLGRAMYGSETRRADWLHDLRLLAAATWEEDAPPDGEGRDSGAPPGSPRAAGGDEAEPSVQTGDLEISAARVTEPLEGGRAAAYMRIRNVGAADTLLSVAFPGATAAALHETRREGGMVRMVPLGRLPLPPGSRAVLEPGGLHIMLDGVRSGGLVAGDSAEIILVFARAGRVGVPARVVPYADVRR